MLVNCLHVYLSYHARAPSTGPSTFSAHILESGVDVAERGGRACTGLHGDRLQVVISCFWPGLSAIFLLIPLSLVVVSRTISCLYFGDLPKH
jgi:hypothetical protein